MRTCLQVWGQPEAQQAVDGCRKLLTGIGLQPGSPAMPGMRGIPYLLQKDAFFIG